MKIGTLTVHLPANYGNALQMLSLHRYIKSMGYDTEVVSHWWAENKAETSLWHLYCKKSPIHLVLFLTACLTFTFKFTAYIKEHKLNKWLKKNIKWSDAAGWGGKFPVDNLNVDKIVVGSDQIWNSNCAFVKFFMLPDFSDKIKKIAYAASFNSSAFPEKEFEFYEKNFNRFHRISVRESSSVSLIEKKFKISPASVCDPVLLHTKDEWLDILNVKKASTQNYNMCYIVSPKGQEYYNDIIRIAKTTKKKLHIFAYDCTEVSVRGKNFFRVAVNMIFARFRLFLSGGRLHLSADPSEFVRYLSNCDTLFTDSFHGLMFASIFEKKCNVVIGADKERQEMKAKLVDFINDFCDNSIITEKFNPSAAKSIITNHKLKTLITYSKEWLRDALSS